MRCKLQLNGFLEFYFNNIIIYQLLVHYYIILQLYIKIIYIIIIMIMIIKLLINNIVFPSSKYKYSYNIIHMHIWNYTII